MTAHGADCAWPLQASSVVQHLMRLMVLCLVGLLVLTTGWLLLRRFSGGLEQPLPALGFLLLGLAIAGLLMAAEAMACRLSGPPAGQRRCWLIGHRILLTASGAALGIAVSLPGTPLAPAAAFWLPVGVGVAWVWRQSTLGRWTRLPRLATRTAGSPQAMVPATAVSAARHQELAEPAFRDVDAGDESEGEEILLPDDVSQRIVRARDSRGAEVIYGTLRCVFASGQRQQSVHVAFCPPLEAIAELTADQLSGPVAQIKTSMLETFGASLELKLASPSRQPADVQIQFFAFEKPASDAGM